MHVFLGALLILSAVAVDGGSINNDQNVQLLFEAIKADSSKSFNEMSQQYFQGQVASLRNATGWTALHVAAFYGAEKITEYLLVEARVNLNDKNLLGETPLHLACLNNHATIAEQFIRAAKDRQIDMPTILEAEQIEGRTPIFYAVKASIEVVSVLLSEQINLLHVDIYGMQPIHYAIASRNFETTNVLLTKLPPAEAAMQQGQCQHFGKTLSHLAAEYNFVQFVEKAYDHFNFSSVDALGQNPACWAAINGSIDLAKYMLQTGQDILTGNCVYGKNNEVKGTPLHAAAYHRRKEYVELLLNSGAKEMARDSTNGTVVHAMARQSNFQADRDAADIEKILQLLLERHMIRVFQAQDNLGRTPFLVAVESSALLFARILQENSIVDQLNVDNDGNSALHLVSNLDFLKYLLSLPRLFSNIEIRTTSTNLTVLLAAVKRRAPIQVISYIITLGADRRAVNHLGQNAVHLAVGENHTQSLATIEWLSGYSFNFSARDNQGRTPLMYAIELGHISAAAKIIELLPAVVVNEKMLDSLDSPLHLAVMKAPIELVRKLVSSPHVDVSARNGKNETALHKAVAYLNVDAVKILLANGATSSLVVVDVYQRTPLHWIATWCSPVAVEIAMLMIDALPADSAALRIRDFEDFQPLDIAIRQNCIETVQLIMAGLDSASCQKANSQGLTPWQQAKTYGYELMAESLEKKRLCSKQSLPTNCEEALRQANATSGTFKLQQSQGQLPSLVYCSDVVYCKNITFLGIDNGFVSEGPSVAGSKRSVSCKSGYRLVGFEDIECDNKGKWIVRGYCEEIRCRDEPVIQLGIVSTGLSDIGAKRQLTCIDGADLSGSALIKCGSNGKWIVGGHCQPVDCETIHSADSSLPSGVYTIYQPGRPSIVVYCDMTYLGGGWTVFQRRVDGSQDFYLKWADYKKGFGNLSANFWLGNDNIHAITSTDGKYEYNLLIALTANDGSTGYALYDGFHIEDEANLYTLRFRSFKVNGNNIGDSLDYNNGRKFSTLDSDNDSWHNHCARDHHKGAWWYGACTDSNLNGVYGISGNQGLTWTRWSGHTESMKATAMMIRRSSL